MLLWPFSLVEDIGNKNKSTSATTSVDQQSDEDAIEWLPKSSKWTVLKETNFEHKKLHFYLNIDNLTKYSDPIFFLELFATNEQLEYILEQTRF